MDTPLEELNLVAANQESKGDERSILSTVKEATNELPRLVDVATICWDEDQKMPRPDRRRPSEEELIGHLVHVLVLAGMFPSALMNLLLEFLLLYLCARMETSFLF